MSQPERSFSVPSRRIARSLWWIAVLLVIASLGGQWSRFVLGHERLFGLVYFFNVDKEENLPSLFSVLLLAFASVLLFAIARLEGRKPRARTALWTVLALGFALMAVDEAWYIHEGLVTPLRKMLGAEAHGIFYFAWVAPALVLVLSLGILYWRFLLNLPRSTRIRFVVAALLYLGGAIGMEMVGGRYVEKYGSNHMTYSFINTAEEGLEMAGSIAFIHALLDYLAEHHGEITFRFAKDAAS